MAVIDNNSITITAPEPISVTVTEKGVKGDKGDTGETGATGATGRWNRFFGLPPSIDFPSRPSARLRRQTVSEDLVEVVEPKGGRSKPDHLCTSVNHAKRHPAAYSFCGVFGIVKNPELPAG